VVRKLEVHPTDMQVKRRAERRQRHRSALRVPAGPSFAPRAGPRGLAGSRSRAGGAPHGDVERIVAVVTERRITGGELDLLGHGPRAVRGQPGPGRHMCTAKPHRSPSLVGGTDLQQRLTQRDDLRDVVVRAGLVRGPANTEDGHIAVEPELLHCGEAVEP
jgi:hypothetical protein